MLRDGACVTRVTQLSRRSFDTAPRMVRHVSRDMSSAKEFTLLVVHLETAVGDGAERLRVGSAEPLRVQLYHALNNESSAVINAI